MALGIARAPTQAKRLVAVPPNNSWEKEPSETVMYGGERKTVYERFILIHERSELRPVMDREGRPAYHSAPPGAQPKQIYERVETIPLYLEDGSRNPRAVREFIMHQGVTTNIDIIEHFRETAAQIATKKTESRRKTMLDRLLDRLAANPEKIEELLGDDAPTGDSFKVQHKGFGKYNVEDSEGHALNEEPLTKVEAQALVEKANEG